MSAVAAALKKKLDEAQVDADSAQDELDNTKKKLREEKETKEVAECELRDVERKVKLVSTEVEKGERKLTALKNQMAKATKLAGSSSDPDQNMLAGMDDEEKAAELEKKLREAKEHFQSVETKLEEAGRKHTQLEKEQVTKEGQLKTAQANVKKMQSRLEATGKTVQSAESSDLKEAEKEESNQEEYKKLMEQQRETEQTAEAAERACVVINKDIQSLEGALKKEKAVQQKLQAEIGKMVDSINKL